MTTKTIAKISVLVLFLIYLFILFVGQTTLDTSIETDQNGNKTIINQKADSGFERIQPSILKGTPDIGRHFYIKKDFIFISFYELGLNLSSITSIADQNLAGISFKATLPGQITSTNADKIDGNILIWEEINSKESIEASSRSIRWWLIGLTTIVVGFLIVIHFYRLADKVLNIKTKK